jgi:DNA-binding NtrC family response regulator
LKNAKIALLVTSESRRPLILGDLESLGVEVLTVRSCGEARGLLETRPPVALVITDVSLKDGNWCDIFKHLIDNGIQASVVVNSSQADERLWSEVLWRGGYDMLVEPYGRDELRRTVEGALRAVHGLHSGIPTHDFLATASN